MARKVKSSVVKRAEEGLIQAPKIEEAALTESTADFERNFKPIFEEMEEWRRESASSQARVY